MAAPANRSDQGRPWILPLGSPLATRDAVGGKALFLGRMLSAGLPVPPGFAITTDAWRHAAPAASQSTQPLLPEELVTAIETALDHLAVDGEGTWEGREHGWPMAVRSSAVLEDLPGLSFAGQQDSFLYLTRRSEIVAAVAACWASLHNPRARAYRTVRGIGGAGMAIAVLVQRLIPAEVAGVLMTADPLRPVAGGMVVEANWGLGSSVVEGRVTPDRFVLDRGEGRVLDETVGDKAVMLSATGGRLAWTAVERERRGVQCLSSPELAALFRLGHRIEDLLGAPQEIEWALCDGRFHVLQARRLAR